MKTINFIYQEAVIQFLLDRKKNVMVNATEMAGLFDKQPVHFLRNEQTENFIQTCCFDKNFHQIFGFGTESLTANSQLGNKILTEEERRNCLYETKKGGHNPGTWMHEILALKLAAWLDPDFEFWVFSQIREITFGHYRKHWDAHVKQENAKTKMIELKTKLLINPTPEDVFEYFKAEQEVNNSKAEKMRAIKGQYNIEF